MNLRSWTAVSSKLYAGLVRPAVDNLRGRPGPEIVAKTSAILIAIASVTLAIWAVCRSHSELLVDRPSNCQDFAGHPKTYQFTILSVDEVIGKAQASVQLVLNRNSCLAVSSLRQPNESALPVRTEKFYFGPVEVRDLGPAFEMDGLIPLVLLPEWPLISEPSPGFTREAPRPLVVELSAVGDPQLYPFDRYVVIGMANSDVLASFDQKSFEDIAGERTEVYLRASGFVLRDAGSKELDEWPTAANKAAIRRDGQFESRVFQDFVKSTTKDEFFAVVLQRPFFLKFLSIFLLAIVLVSMAFSILHSEAKAFGAQALGYFLGLWAARQILVAGGPKTFTTVDYTVLILYCVLAACFISKSLWAYRSGTKRAAQALGKCSMRRTPSPPGF